MPPLLHFVLLSSALNYPALVTFVSLKYPIQLIFKGITRLCASGHTSCSLLSVETPSDNKHSLLGVFA